MSVDAVVVGAGVVGCAVARELAADHDVLVVERGRVAGGTTALSAGEVTMTPSYSDVPAVAEHANDFFRAYSGTGAFTFHEHPSYELVECGREPVARRRVERLRDAGIDVDFVDAETLTERHPRFRVADVDGAVRHADTGFVDPYTFAVTLKDDAEDAGARFVTDTEVRGLRTDDGRVTGVDTDDGAFDASRVVVAAGWRTERFLRGRLEVPIRPYRTQCVVVSPGDGLDAGFPMGAVPTEHVYFRPASADGGDLLVGGWAEAVDDGENASARADEAFREHVADVLGRFFVGFDDARVVDGWAGVDGATPDTRPVIDRPAAGPEGLVVAAGFHGRGVMTAPVAATLVGDLLRGDDSPFPREPFAYSRFDSTSPEFAFRSVTDGDDDYDQSPDAEGAGSGER